MTSSVLNGTTITGMYVQLRQSGTGNVIGDGFTPVTFSNLNAGSHYVVVAYSYGSLQFRHFADGTLLRYETVTAGTPVALNAVYEQVPQALSSTLNVVAQLANGTVVGGTSVVNGAIIEKPGLWITLTVRDQCYPYTAAFSGSSSIPWTLFMGQYYTVYAASYQGYQFSHWASNNSTNPNYIVKMQGDVKLWAIYTYAAPSTTSSSSSSASVTTAASSSSSSAATSTQSSSTSTATPTCTTSWWTTNGSGTPTITVSSTSSSATSTSATSSATSSSAASSSSSSTTMSISSSSTTATSTSAPSSSSTTSSSSTVTATSAPSSTTTSTTSAASSSSAASGGAYTITMPQGVGANSALNFSPSTLSVGAGSTITFSDQDTTAPHNVVWKSMPSGASVPNSPIVMTSGNTFTVTLTVPGTYSYYCQYHSAWMQGTITVT